MSSIDSYYMNKISESQLSDSLCELMITNPSSQERFRYVQLYMQDLDRCEQVKRVWTSESRNRKDLADTVP